MTLLDRARSLLKRRPPSTEGHTETARETGVTLGIMAQAAAAPEPTAEQQIFLGQSEVGLRNRLSVLLGIPNRSLAQEREKIAIEGWLTRGSEPVQSVSAPRRLFALPFAASPLTAILFTPWTLVIAFMALVGVQTGRLNHAKADLAQARRDTHTAVQIAHDWEARAEQYRQGLVDAANVAHQAAAALDAERQAQARAAARERRRNREIASVLAHSPDAPAWRLRDDQPATDQPTAPTP